MTPSPPNLQRSCAAIEPSDIGFGVLGVLLRIRCSTDERPDSTTHSRSRADHPVWDAGAAALAFIFAMACLADLPRLVVRAEPGRPEVRPAAGVKNELG